MEAISDIKSYNWTLFSPSGSKFYEGWNYSTIAISIWINKPNSLWKMHMKLYQILFSSLHFYLTFFSEI